MNADLYDELHLEVQKMAKEIGIFFECEQVEIACLALERFKLEGGKLIKK